MSYRKAFVCDFDGTLYRHDAVQAISDDDVAAISAYQSAGGLFGVSTNRPAEAVSLQVGDLVDFDFAMLVGGALVSDAAGTVFFERRMPFDAVAHIVGAYAPRAVGVVIAASGGYYAVGSRGHRLVRDVASLSELPPALYGVSLATTSPTVAAALTAEINVALGDAVTAVQNASGVDVVAAGCSKAAALTVVRDALALDVVAAMGDAENDSELLAAANVAYALAGAPAELTDVADRVMPNVAQALDDFLLTA